MDSKLAAHILNEHLTEGLSHRKLARKYGISRMQIYRMLKKNKQTHQEQKMEPIKEYPEELSEDIAFLKEELRKARLKIELQDLMIDIASKELGVDIRKKVWHQAVLIKMRSQPRGLRGLCRLLGYTAQAYYQHQSFIEKRTIREELLLQQVIYHRRLQPRVGARKLLVMMQSFMSSYDMHIGRDVFYELLRVNGFLIRRKRSGVRTTFSAHRLKKYADLVKGYSVSRADEVWVSDITYIHLYNGFAYLSLVTDAYSRKIMGYYVSRELTADGCIKALQMALNNRCSQAPLIHHSDRGVQYCSSEYVRLLNDTGCTISMTQSGDPRDNAIAERVNGILKQELLARVYPEFTGAATAVKNAIDIYNQLRPHSSVDMLTPEQAYFKTGPIHRRWKGYFRPQAREVYMDG